MAVRISDVKHAIEAAHGVRSHLISLERVVLREEGAVVWEGEVFVFRLNEHPFTSRCFVWGEGDELVIVLQSRLVATPEDAVRSTIRTQKRDAGETENEVAPRGSEVTVNVRFRAKSGLERLLRQELLALLGPIRDEPACLRFEMFQAHADPESVLLQATWKSEADLERNFRSERVQQACARCGELMADEAEICRWYPIA